MLQYLLTVILYQSKYGATKQYAKWLADQTGFSMVETKKADIEQIKVFDTVILGGGIYASGIAGLSFLRKHMDVLQDKKLVVFCVGASPFEKTAFQEIVKHNMKDALQNIPCFYCRGAWDLEKMSFVDRTLCKLLQKSVAKKSYNELETWQKALAEAGNQSCDWTDPAYLKPILQYLEP